MGAFNPASTRIKERLPSTLDYTGIQGLIFPAGSVVSVGHGFVMIDVALSAAAGGGVWTFELEQNDVSNPRVLTIPGTDTWVVHTIRIYLQGQRLRTSLLVIGGAGNRTVTLDATVPVDFGDDLEGEGWKA